MIFGKKESEDRNLVVAYKVLLGSHEGKAVLFDLMNRFHVLNSHSGNEFDEGQRSVVLHMMAQCKINLTEFDKLLEGQV